jgi:hypothetical protein
MAQPSIQAVFLWWSEESDMSTTMETQAQTSKILSMKSSNAPKKNVQKGVTVGGGL